MPENWIGIGIGSNQDSPLERVREARERIRKAFPWTELKSSSWFTTSPVGPVEQDDFINGVVVGRCDAEPDSILARLLEIERLMGRVREVRWGPRRVDLDLLFVGNAVIDTENLVLPHPRLHERGFVLVPMAEVCEEWIHPILKMNGRQMVRAWMQERPAEERVVPIEHRGPSEGE